MKLNEMAPSIITKTPEIKKTKSRSKSKRSSIAQRSKKWLEQKHRKLEN
jgi:hypothetical protein